MSDSPSRHVSVRQLRYFVAVADHRSFRRAAESLFISQPPITKQIQALEHALGATLLDRVRHKLALTAAGEALYAEARMLLGGLDRVCNTIRAFHLTAPRTFVIGMADDFVYGRHLDRLLDAAESRGVRLDTTVGLSPSLELQVTHGVIDAALVSLPLTSEAAGLVVQPLAPSRICLLVKKSHPLARLKKASPSVLQGAPLMTCPEVPANSFARLCEKLFVAGRISPTIVHRSTSTAIIARMVERGLGIGIISEHSVRPNNSQLKCIPLEASEALYQHAVIYRADRSNADMIQLLSCLQPETARVSRSASRTTTSARSRSKIK